MADVIRDTLLDWNPDAEDEPDRPPLEPLPPVPPARLIDAMRPKVEDALAEVAGALNESAHPAALEARCKGLHERFVELLAAALDQGEKLRIDAAVGARPVPGGHGGWAEQFRRIKASEGRLTESPPDGSQ